MMPAARLVAWLVALAWLWKLIAASRGLPRIPNLLDGQYDQTPVGEPSITVIIPARDEAAAIAATLESLLTQDYRVRIIAVDDRSTDATGSIMDAIAARYPGSLTVLHIADLPAGWLGKTHAMALAARHAMAMQQPDYLLFTDADVLFHPEAVRRSLARAVAIQADNFVAFPTPIVKTAGEGMMLGYLQVIGLWATRPWRADDPRALRDSIGIGAFNLVRASAYRQLGGLDAIRMEILEDLTFARRVKQARLRQRVAIAPGMVSLHWASGAFGIVRGMTKNLFAVFGFSVSLVLLTGLCLTALCIGPAIFIFLHGTRIPAILAFASIAGLYILSSRHSRISPWYAIFFPAGAALFLFSLLRSTWTTLRQGGVTWRGTFYPLAGLRIGKGPLR